MNKIKINFLRLQVFIIAVFFVGITFASATIVVKSDSNGSVSATSGRIFVIPQASAAPPEELLDISFIAEHRTYSKSSQLVTRTTFDSFGTKPTNVDMVYTVLDSENKEMYRRMASAVVETQGVFVMRYSDLKLPHGSYRAHLRTIYGDKIIDDFEIQFTVSGKIAEDGGVAWWVWGIVFILFPAVYGAYFGVIDRRIPRDYVPLVVYEMDEINQK